MVRAAKGTFATRGKNAVIPRFNPGVHAGMRRVVAAAKHAGNPRCGRGGEIYAIRGVDAAKRGYFTSSSFTGRRWSAEIMAASSTRCV